MIRTVIEVSAEDEYHFTRELEATLDKLGYEPKPSEEHVRWRRDLYDALITRGFDPSKLVEEYRAKCLEKQAA